MKVAECTHCNKVKFYVCALPSENIPMANMTRLAHEYGWWSERGYWLCPKCNTYDARAIYKARNERLED